MRYHAGIVTDEMLSLPKTPYLFVGMLEALGAASGMAAGGNSTYLNLMSDAFSLHLPRRLKL